MSLPRSTTLPQAEQLMARALRLARKALGRTDPNPMVGAVIVKRGRIVGEGYHHAAGLPHAEVEAVRAAGADARGAEMFVTLEPCNHHGRTPPCVQAILEAGISAVWYGMADPNPGVAGGGAEALRNAGVEVHGPILEDRCKRLNEVFIINVTQRRPFVYLKLAVSLDGRIATRSGHSQWITSEQSRRRVHLLRSRVSAVMVGIGTALADNPSLTTRLPGRRGRDPVRIVADSSLRLPLDSKIINQVSTAGTIAACRKNPPAAAATRLKKAGVTTIKTSGVDRVDLDDLMARLFEMRITSVLIEGGAGLAWGALEARTVHRCLFYYAPIIIGGVDSSPSVGGLGIDLLHEAVSLRDVEITKSGPDILVTGSAVYPSLSRVTIRESFAEGSDAGPRFHLPDTTTP